MIYAPSRLIVDIWEQCWNPVRRWCGNVVVRCMMRPECMLQPEVQAACSGCWGFNVSSTRAAWLWPSHLERSGLSLLICATETSSGGENSSLGQPHEKVHVKGWHTEVPGKYWPWVWWSKCGFGRWYFFKRLYVYLCLVGLLPKLVSFKNYIRGTKVGESSIQLPKNKYNQGFNRRLTHFG